MNEPVMDVPLTISRAPNTLGIVRPRRREIGGFHAFSECQVAVAIKDFELGNQHPRSREPIRLVLRSDRKSNVTCHHRTKGQMNRVVARVGKIIFTRVPNAFPVGIIGILRHLDFESFRKPEARPLDGRIPPGGHDARAIDALDASKIHFRPGGGIASQ